MCGICGFVSKRNISLELLKQMNDTMVHRGPDDSGAEIFPSINDFNVGMAQRRLSILDLSDKGHQPMWSGNRDIVIVFNGEIYNFIELRKEIKDYIFQTNTDTEVILAAYLKWGKDIVNRIQGMFAIAIFDRRSQELILIRDHIGKKPLYFYVKDNEIYFASELKPIVSLKWIDKTINRSILARYLFQQYINAPDSIFEYVSKVEPGTIVTIKIKNQLNIKKEKFWDVNSAYHKYANMQITDYNEAKNVLEELLLDSVRKRLISDVPVGCLLSGGIDSTLVAALAQKTLSESLKTYTIGFAEKEYNEAIYAKEVASYLGTKHTEMYILEEEMLEQVSSIAQYYDEPFADSSQIPSMLVASLVKREATVCLTGDGGDEIFGGYGVYDRVRKAQLLRYFGKLAFVVGEMVVSGEKISERYPDKVRKIAYNNDRETESQLNPDVMLNNAYRMLKNEDVANCQYSWEQKYGVYSWPERRMLLDLETLLPGDMLCKVDRASMKYSVEMRNPILDINVIEYAFRIPQKYKYAGGRKKFILKQLVYDYVPKNLLDRPKKGFSVPIEKWMRGPLREQITDYMDESFLLKQGIFEPKFVNKFIGGFLNEKMEKGMEDINNARLVWAFFVFQQWYEEYFL